MSTHHHGPLAGVPAAGIAVLTGGGLILAVARRELGEVATVAAWALMTAVAGAVIAAAVYVFLWLRHRALHPETLAGRQVIQAEALQARQDRPGQPIEARPIAQLPPEPRPQLEGSRKAIEPPREIHLHLNGLTPDQLAAILRHHAGEDS